MKIIPLDVSQYEDPVNAIESVATKLGLTSKRLSLASLPGSIHWHFSQPGIKGTLEATCRPDKREAWLSVHENRQAVWMGEAIISFHRLLNPSSSSAP